MMVVLGLLTLLAVLTGVATVLIGIRFMLDRWRDPEHSLRRSAGICLKIVGPLALALGGAFLLGLLFESDAPMLEAYSEPGRSGRIHHENVSQLLSPGALSVWLLLSGAATGFGVSLNIRRFSLRAMLVALVLVALVASLPQILVQPKDQKAVISAKTDRVLNAGESTSLEHALGKESLCKVVGEEVRKALPFPVSEARKKVELQLQTTGELESSGTVGVRLTLWFSHDLNRQQIEGLFDALSRHVQNAMASADGHGP